MNREKWAEIKLNWQRYGDEYITVALVVLLLLVFIWFFVLRPITKLFENNERSELKTTIIRNIDGNISRIPAKNENQAEEIKNRLEAIKKDDRIESFKSITINQNGDRFEVIIIFGRD